MCSFETQGLGDFIYFAELLSISPLTETKTGWGPLAPAPQREFGVRLCSHTAASAQG